MPPRASVVMQAKQVAELDATQQVRCTATWQTPETDLAHLTGISGSTSRRCWTQAPACSQRLLRETAFASMLPQTRS